MHQEGRRTEEHKQKGEAAAGTEEEGDKGGQAVARGEGAELAAGAAGGRGEKRGEHVAARPRADPFNLAASDRLGVSVVEDILVLSKVEGEKARRMAVGGQWGPRGSRRHPMCRQLP